MNDSRESSTTGVIRIVIVIAMLEKSVNDQSGINSRGKGQGRLRCRRYGQIFALLSLVLEVLICSSHLTPPRGQLSQCSCRFCRCWGCQPCQALVSVCRVWHLEDRHLFKGIDSRWTSCSCWVVGLPWYKVCGSSSSNS